MKFIKTVKTVICVTSALFLLSACFDDISDFKGNMLIDEYQRSGSNDGGVAVFEHLKERNELDIMEPEKVRVPGDIYYIESDAHKVWVKLVNKAFFIALEKNDGRIAAQISDLVGLDEIYLTNDQLDKYLLSMVDDKIDLSLYSEAISSAIAYKGKNNIKQKRYFEAYSNFTRAFILSYRKDVFSGYVRMLLAHFGCKQDLLAWGEFSEALPAEILISGSPYPELPLDVDFNVGLARKALNNISDVPELQETCPINLYK